MIRCFFGCVSCHWSRILSKLSANSPDFTSFAFYTTTSPSAVRHARREKIYYCEEKLKIAARHSFRAILAPVFRSPCFTRGLFPVTNNELSESGTARVLGQTSFWHILWSTSRQKDKNLILLLTRQAEILNVNLKIVKLTLPFQGS